MDDRKAFAKVHKLVVKAAESWPKGHPSYRAAMSNLDFLIKSSSEEPYGLRSGGPPAQYRQ